MRSTLTFSLLIHTRILNDTSRLRQTDIKAGHYERKVQALQNEVDTWEKKYEELEVKHKEMQKELADFRAEVENL